MSHLILNTNLKYQNRKKTKRKLSIKSNNSVKTKDESINLDNYKEKKHVTFGINFINVIDVESWKEFNFDVCETDADWVKVEPETKITTKNNNIINNNTIKNINIKKDDKVSCQCKIFFSIIVL